MLVFALCAPLFGEDMETDFTGQGGEPLVTRGDFVLRGTVLVQYRGRAEHVVIPANLGITAIGDEAFMHRDIESITIPEGVREIGRSFVDCFELTTVRLPSTLRRIGDDAFQACYSLANINIPSGVAFIGDSVFEYCSNLRAITIPESVTFIGRGAFSGCEKLSSINIPSHFTAIGNGLFAGSSISSITISSNITSIGDGAFSNCRNLKSVTIPASVTSIGKSAFSRCENIVSINIPLRVSSIGDSAFSFCDSLSSITVDGRNSAYSASEGVLFDKNKTALVRYPEGKPGNTYTIPRGVTSIEGYAFGGCVNLKTIILSRNTRLEDGADIPSRTKIIYHEDMEEALREKEEALEAFIKSQIKHRNAALIVLSLCVPLCAASCVGIVRMKGSA